MFERFLTENISFENGKKYDDICFGTFFVPPNPGFQSGARGGGTHFTPQNWTFFWTFINVHLGLYAPPFLKQKTRTPKNRVCDHYALKTHFRPRKTVTELFGGETLGCLLDI